MNRRVVSVRYRWWTALSFAGREIVIVTGVSMNELRGQCGTTDGCRTTSDGFGVASDRQPSDDATVTTKTKALE